MKTCKNILQGIKKIPKSKQDDLGNIQMWQKSVLPIFDKFVIRQENSMYCSKIVFSHPDYTVGTGITPVQPFFKREKGHGLYHRSGLAPYPKDISFLLETQYSTAGFVCQLFILIIWQPLFGIGNCNDI